MTSSNTFVWVTIFAISAAVVNSLGIWLIYKNREWAEKTKVYFMCFAAGILISSPLMFSFPQAVYKNAYAGFTALAGFLFMFFSNEIIKRKTKQKSLAFGITTLEGIAIHSFIDGIIYSVTFSVSIAVGVLAGLGLVIHEFAEGVITFSVLVKGGFRKKQAVILAFIAAALTTPMGAFIAYPFLSKLSSSVLGLVLGFVVGILIYISASHLLPEAREYEKNHSMIAFLAGVLLAIFMVLSKII